MTAETRPQLSVIMPAYTEIHTIGEILVRVSAALPGVTKEIVIVDDCSADGSREWLVRNIPAGRVQFSSYMVY